MLILRLKSEAVCRSITICLLIKWKDAGVVDRAALEMR